MREGAAAGVDKPKGSIPARRRLIGRFGVLAVDVVRFWPLPVVLSGVLAFAFLGLENPVRYVTMSYHGLVGLTAFIVGLACANDDRDRGTLWLLRGLPLGPVRLLWQKLTACLVLMLVFFLAAEAVTHLSVLFPISWPGWLFPSLGNYNLPTFWNFGVWLPLSLAQVLCLIMVGLSFGVVFKNFVYSAIVGLAVYVLWYAAWKWTFGSLEQTGHARQFHLAMTGQQLALAAGAAALFVRAVAYRDFPAGIGRIKARSSEDVKPLRRRMVRPPWQPWTTPFGGRLLVTALLVAVATTVAAAIFAFKSREAGMSSGYGDLNWLIITIPAAVIGVSLFSREELFAHTSLIYLQPVSRANMLAERLPSLVIYSVLASLPAIMFNPMLSQTSYLPLICLCVGTALLGALARLFYRNPMFPLILTLIIAMGWEVVFVILDNRLGDQPEYAGYTARFAQQAWFSAVVIVLPLAALKTAFTNTQLLTVPESARSFLGVSVLYCLGVVVCLLIGAQIGELAWLVSHWMASALGLKMGGAS